MKGGDGETDNMLTSFNTKGKVPSGFFLFIHFHPISSPESSGRSRFCSCGILECFNAGYKSLINLTTLESAVCRRVGVCSNNFTSQVAKCEFLSKYQNHHSNPNTHPVIAEKGKSLNIYFGKELKLAGGAVCFSALHISASLSWCLMGINFLRSWTVWQMNLP